MSVILGYKTDKKIYLAADNRSITVDNKIIKDDVKKIILVDDVALAFSGVGLTQQLFDKMIVGRKKNKVFKVEDALKVLKFIHRYCKLTSWYSKPAKIILELSSRMIVAGKNRNNEYCMYTISYLHGKLEKPSLTEHFLFPPDDVSPKECYDIFVNNVCNSKQHFAEQTIKDISQISSLVSSCGDIVVFDIENNDIITEYFC